MKKQQDKESLIKEIEERLEWYTTEASEEEFDEEEVMALMNLLDTLDPMDESGKKTPEEALEDFWKYKAQRDEDERRLAEFAAENEEATEADAAEETKETAAEEVKESNVAPVEAGADEKTSEKPKEKGKIRRYIHRHRAVVVAAAVLVLVFIGGFWQEVASAENAGGFFWWMHKDEEGVTMITSPEISNGDTGGVENEIYSKVKDVPLEYREYVEEILEISLLNSFELQYIEIGKNDDFDAIHELLKNSNDEVIQVWIKLYHQEILRVRETYPGYSFCEEFEDNGIKFDVFSKKETNGEYSYIMYFYYGNEKYIISGKENKEELKNLVIEYRNIVEES